jgi:MoaA/NifB/PqqE/SkfB family radical SAM enzyme
MANIKSNKYIIKAVQLDVNGICNSSCWFCPVAYAGNPKSAIRDMPIEEIENIFIQLTNGKGDFVDPSLSTIYSANYNEVLLYKDFDKMLSLYKKYNFKTNILTNGVNLTKSKTDLLIKNRDVIQGILLNIPSSDAYTWSKYVGMNIKLFPKVISNVKYFIEENNKLSNPIFIHLMINGIDEMSLTKNGGWLDLLENAPKIDLNLKNGDLQKEYNQFKEIFPDLSISTANHLYDRAAHLETYKIMTQASAIEKYLKPNGPEVVGCNGGIEIRSRTNEWIHINPNGDLFICCADYDFETIYGNAFKNSIKDIWHSKDRKDMVNKSYSTMCRSCSAAIWG